MRTALRACDKRPGRDGSPILTQVKGSCDDSGGQKFRARTLPLAVRKWIGRLLHASFACILRFSSSFSMLASGGRRSLPA